MIVLSILWGTLRIMPDASAVRGCQGGAALREFRVARRSTPSDGQVVDSLTDPVPSFRGSAVTVELETLLSTPGRHRQGWVIPVGFVWTIAVVLSFLADGLFPQSDKVHVVWFAVTLSALGLTGAALTSTVTYVIVNVFLRRSVSRHAALLHPAPTHDVPQMRPEGT